jgi:hypothetical protein
MSAGEAKATMQVSNATWPGGVGMFPPDAGHPYWRTAEGKRYSLATVLAGASDDDQRWLLDAHVAAIAAITQAAADIRLAQGSGLRRLTTCASRLLGELANQYPQGSWDH